jgi:hypothetical protein
MIGGILFGIIIWLITRNLFFPDFFNQIIKIIFNFIFFIK